MKSLVAVFTFFLIILLIPGFLVLIWLGWFPGLSAWLGMNKVQDLGITYTQQDLVNADRKRGSKMETLFISSASPKETLKYSGRVTLEGSYNSAEISAILNRWAENWCYFPLSEIQFKINEDDSVELSARFRRDRIKGYAEAMGYPPDQLEDLLKISDLFKVDLSIYLKGTGLISDREIALEIQRLKINRFSIPLGIYAKRVDDFAGALKKDWIESVPGCDLQSLVIKNKLLILKGTYPAVELVAKWKVKICYTK